MNGDATQKRAVPPQAKNHDPHSSEPFDQPVHLSSTLSRRLSGPKAPITAAGVTGEGSFHTPRLHNQEELVDPSGFDNWDQEWEERPSEDDDYGDMPSDLRPPLHRPTDGRSHQPLLSGKPPDYDEDRPTMSRSTTFHERDPEVVAARATRQRYIYASFFLVLSLISFVVQTETAVYVADHLGWKKSYCML
jgi:hypothetical protein